jgi:hypothetical protein
LSCALLTSCLSGLAFKTDERLRITSPRDRAEVSLPVTARWTVSDFEITGPTPAGKPNAGYFGVFVDRAPQPPGERFVWFAKDDRHCLRVEGCPNEKYFSDRGVFSTQETSFTIDSIPSTLPVGSVRREFHELTVVLLDGTGRRIGESSWFAQFQLKREES